MTRNGSIEPKNLNDQEPTTNELRALAKDFIRDVKARFVDQPQSYIKFFVEVTKALCLKDAGSITRIKDVLEGHNDLLLRLNPFLPKPFRPGFSDHGDTNNHQNQDPPTNNNEQNFALALNIVNDVKARFFDRPERYNMFCKELTEAIENGAILGEGRRLIWLANDGSIDRIKAVLEGHNDLLLRFNLFLPAPFQHFFSDGELKFLMQQEQAMCKVGDLLYEKDMWLHWLRLACEFLEEIINGEDFGGRLGRRFVKKVLLQRCVEKIWGRYAAVLLKMFHRNSKRLAPILLERLEEKVKEMERERLENVQK